MVFKWGEGMKKITYIGEIAHSKYDTKAWINISDYKKQKIRFEIM